MTLRRSKRGNELSPPPQSHFPYLSLWVPAFSLVIFGKGEAEEMEGWLGDVMTCTIRQGLLHGHGILNQSDG